MSNREKLNELLDKVKAVPPSDPLVLLLIEAFEEFVDEFTSHTHSFEDTSGDSTCGYYPVIQTSRPD